MSDDPGYVSTLMAWVFPQPKPYSEIMKEHSQNLRHLLRKQEREQKELEGRERGLLNEIRKLAQQQKMREAEGRARALVRLRNNIERKRTRQDEIDALLEQAREIASMLEESTAMKGMTLAMMASNRQSPVVEMRRMIMEFEKSQLMISQKCEMISDTMQSVTETEFDEADRKTVLGQVLDELGFDVANTLASPPSSLPAARQAAASSSHQRSPVALSTSVSTTAAAAAPPSPTLEDLEIQSRFENLKKPK